MSNKELAKSYLRRAEERIRHTSKVLDSGNYLRSLDRLFSWLFDHNVY